MSKHHFRVNSRAQIIGETEGLVKVIAKREADGSAGQILGVHMVGPWVTEQLSGGYLAVNWEATVQEAIDFVMPHPSLTELFGESVMALTGRSIWFRWGSLAMAGLGAVMFAYTARLLD